MRVRLLPDSGDSWRKIAAEPLDEAFAKVLRAAKHPQVALKWAHAPVMFDAAGAGRWVPEVQLRGARDRTDPNYDRCK